MSNILTTDAAAREMRVTSARIRQFISEGRLASEKVGRDHLIQKADLDEFKKSGKRARGRPKKKAKKSLRVRKE